MRSYNSPASIREFEEEKLFTELSIVEDRRCEGHHDILNVEKFCSKPDWKPDVFSEVCQRLRDLEDSLKRYTERDKRSPKFLFALVIIDFNQQSSYIYKIFSIILLLLMQFSW